MRKIASFPFTFIDNSKLGKIYRPYVSVSVFSKLRNKWQPVEMVIDSGADYSLFPKKYADIFGIDLKKECFIEKTMGIGGSEKVYQLKKLKIKLEDFEKEIPVGFLERDDIPPLFGRLGCLEIFRLIFEEKTSVFWI